MNNNFTQGFEKVAGTYGFFKAYSDTPRDIRKQRKMISNLGEDSTLEALEALNTKLVGEADGGKWIIDEIYQHMDNKKVKYFNKIVDGSSYDGKVTADQVLNKTQARKLLRILDPHIKKVLKQRVEESKGQKWLNNASDSTKEKAIKKSYLGFTKDMNRLISNKKAKSFTFSLG